MKFLKGFAILPLAGIVLLGAVGCKKDETYELYTNILQESYEVIDDSFKTNAVGGYSFSGKEFEEKDTSAYVSSERLYYAMDTYAQLVISRNTSAEGAEDNYNAFAKSVYNVIDEVNKALSPAVTDSDVYKINNAAAGETVKISKITYEVLSIAIDVFNLTEGCYNPALYYNVDAYGFGLTPFYPESASQLPNDEAIARYTELSKSFAEITISENNGSYFFKKPEKTVEVNGESLALKLDLGGIGKGYVVDRVDELFDLYGYEYGYFSFGSSSMLIKSNVREGDYKVEIINPRSFTRDGYIRIFARDEKLSTSGDYERCYTIDGVRYCHVIDPTTGKPVQNGIMSATVIGGGAAENDALTTAIMCMGKEKAIKFIEEKLTDRKVVFTVSE